MTSCCGHRTNRLEPIEVLSRVVGWENTPIIAANVNSIAWSAYILEQATGDEDETSYLNQALTPVADYVEDVLQRDDKWTEDTTGYNFHFIIPGAVFTERGEWYLVRVTFSMVGGDPFTAVFLIECV